MSQAHQSFNALIWVTQIIVPIGLGVVLRRFWLVLVLSAISGALRPDLFLPPTANESLAMLSMSGIQRFMYRAWPHVALGGIAAAIGAASFYLLRPFVMRMRGRQGMKSRM
jgi:hypothetical protein